MMKELNEISKKSPFKVPENYFEDVNRKILASTAGFDFSIKRESTYRKLRPYLAVAASVAVLAAVSFVAVSIFTSTVDNPRLPEITLNEFSTNYLNDIDVTTLEQGLDFIEPDVASIDLDRKEIIDYLVLENIELNDIYEIL